MNSKKKKNQTFNESSKTGDLEKEVKRNYTMTSNKDSKISKVILEKKTRKNNE